MKHDELQAVLQSCSLHSLLLLTSKVLARSGFGDVQILDRRQTKQKSRYGGHELLCETSLGSVPIKVIAKVICDSIRLRMLDELAGAVIRTEADLGLIISPYPLSSGINQNRGSRRLPRIVVLDGPALAARLTELRIGVRSRSGVDYQFFSHLEEIAGRARAFLQAEGGR